MQQKIAEIPTPKDFTILQTIENLNLGTVIFKYDPSYSPYLEDVEDEWKVFIKTQPNQYNGNLVGISGFELENQSLVLNFFKVDFKTVKIMRRKYKDTNPLKIPTHCAVGSIISNDHYFIFGESEGKPKLIGGMMERHNDTKVDIFSEIKRETLEEVNIAIENTSNPGIALIFTPKRSLTIVGNTISRLTREDIEDRFVDRQDKELDNLIFVPKEDIFKWLKEQDRYFPRLVDIINL